MCGIVGFTGAAQAAPILLDGLAKLEYRGYDSAGLAVQNAAGKIEVVKAKGRLKVLSEMTDGGNALTGTCGIGHTRWATHGEPSVVNAHPHYSNDKKIAIVHNGIIENYLEIKERLTNKGFTFVSQTDTEVLAQLLDYYYMGESAGDPLDAIARTMLHVRGSYALGVLFADEPGTIYAARKDSPLVVGKAENGTLIASDVPALLKYTRTVYYIDNLEIARLTPDSIEFFDTDKEPVQHEASTIEWDTEAAEKGGFEHFMMKEIHEQPAAVRDTLSPRLKDGKIDLSELALDEDAIRGIHRIYIIGCGSAYHVGMAARYVFESLARLPVEVDVASEFRYRNPVLEPDSLALVISQSGETADTLAALRLCRDRGVRTVGIVNVVGSSIAREADATMYTWAGPEISVATTKAYSTQLAACYLLATEFRPRARHPGRRPVRESCGRAGSPARKDRKDAGRQGAHPVVCQQVRQRQRRLLHRPRAGLRRSAGRQSEIQGDQLHPLRGLRRGRDETRPHLSGGEGDTGRGYPDPAGPVRKEHLQHGRGQEPWRFPDGPDHLRQLQHRGHRRFHRLRAQDRPPLCHQPVGHSAAAAGLLRQLCQGPGCRQTAQPGKICHG